MAFSEINAGEHSEMFNRAFQDVIKVFGSDSSEFLESFTDEIVAAKKISCYAGGREGLMVKALTMRMMHLGLDVSYVGDMTTPSLHEGDLFIVSAGPGPCSTVSALVGVAKAAGARTMVITAQPEAVARLNCDRVIHILAQTMVNDTGSVTSILPMGSIFEVSQLFFFEIAILLLREKLKETVITMRDRHTNLE
jgi:6-phospho-3-hexuloisomerase